MTIENTTPPSGAITTTDTMPSFSIDTRDPLARLVRQRIGWSWWQVLLLALVIYGLVEKVVIPGIFGYLRLGSDIGQWSPDGVALLTGFVVYPFLLAFYIWTNQGISDLFLSLWRNKSFGNLERYSLFIRRAETVFNHPLWSLLSLGISFFLILVVHFVLWSPTSEFSVWFGANNNGHRLFALVLIGFVGYAAGQIVLRQSIAIILLAHLLKDMGRDLVIHPYHVDGAGGLGALGQYTVRVSFLLLAVMVYFIGGSLLPSLQRGEALAISLRNPALILGWAFYIVLVPSTFISLLLPAHFAMAAARNAQLSLISAQLDEQLAAAKDHGTADHAKLPDTLKEIEQLKSMRKLILEDFPTWPVSTEIRRQISVSTLLPPAAHFVITLALNVLSPP